MVSTPRESDRIFTPFYLAMTHAIALQAQAFLWAEKDFALRRLFYAENVEQHESRNQPAFFPEERTSCSGCRNRWNGTPDGERIGFSG
jgi:hypothetical protein